MTAFQTFAILLSFAATGAYINSRFLRLPNSIGMTLFALFLSWGAMLAAHVGWIDLTQASTFVASIDFSSILLHGMLSFLLFAGAMHVDLKELKKYRSVVALLATGGVIMATFITGTLVWGIAQAVGIPIPYIDALMFGALIAPTDPVAVLSILKESKVPLSLRAKIGGESLLNDGVAVVLFLTLLDIAQTPGRDMPGLYDIALLFLKFGVGSLALGLAMGGLVYVVLRSIDDYKTEILITLALAAGGYTLAEEIGVSAPIAMVVAGLVIGNQGRAFVMSDKTRKHLDLFWELLDDILNAVLFMLIGLEVMILHFNGHYLAMGVAAIAATLLGRLISVSLPITLMRPYFTFERGVISIMTWGGLRGGISIAMALSLPYSENKNLLLAMTYLTVVFSVLLQGTTFKSLLRRICGVRD